MPGLIVTGISTEVGKTVVSSVITTLLQADYWKPIEAGGSDTEQVRTLSGAVCHPPAYILQHSLSPHHAASLEGVTLTHFPLPLTSAPLVIEGCGGVLCPYTSHSHLGALFSQWNLPWVVVSKHYLGSINHTLLTLAWLKSQEQKVLGVIFNGSPYPEAEQFILETSGLPCLGHLFPEPLLNRRRIQWYARQFAPLWNAISPPFGTPLPKEPSIPLPSL